MNIFLATRKQVLMPGSLGCRGHRCKTAIAHTHTYGKGTSVHKQEEAKGLTTTCFALSLSLNQNSCVWMCAMCTLH